MTHDVVVSNADLAQRIVFLKTIADLVDAELKATKMLAADQFQKGDSSTARSREDVKLGRVVKTDPKPVSRIVDEDALDAYLRAEYADVLIPSLTLGDPAEIVPILRDAGREDLFSVSESVPGWLVHQAEAEALAGKPIPGIEVHTPPGWIQVKVEQAAKDAAKHLLAGAQAQLGIEATR